MLTKSAVAETLRELVEEKGADYVYPGFKSGSCEYSEDGAPSCIVGHVIARLDPEKFAEVAEFEYEHDYSFSVDAFGTYEEAYNEDIDDYEKVYEYPELDTEDGVIQILQTAQRLQDAGHPWGRAVDAALIYVE